jgi:hypothetical protein
MGKVATLLGEYVSALDGLKNLKVILTDNNPAGDLAEWLFAKTYGFKVMRSSETGFDVKDEDKNVRYQVKARRFGKRNWRRLGVIRKFDERHFEKLIVVIFERDFTIRSAHEIKYEKIQQLLAEKNKSIKFDSHQNGVVINWKEDFIAQSGAKDITKGLKEQRSKI